MTDFMEVVFQKVTDNLFISTTPSPKVTDILNLSGGSDEEKPICPY
jgi:hypothetical protein